MHELGHSIAVIIFGGRLTKFNPSPLNAHMNYSGNFTNVELSVINAGGMLFPFIIWIIFVLVCPRRISSIFEYVRLLSSLMILGSMLPWIIIPVINNRPSGDDVTKFLKCSGLNPVYVSLLSLGLFLFSVAITYQKSGGVVLDRIKKIKSEVNKVK